MENGVGMAALLAERFRDAMKETTGTPRRERLVLASGVAAAPHLRRLMAEATAKWPALDATVVAIKNDFFGEHITVSGLVTGQDILKQLADVPMDRLLLPSNMLRQEGDMFLDNVTPEELSRALGVPVEFTNETDGDALLSALLEDKEG